MSIASNFKADFLASIPSPTVSYVDLGPFRIHFYALFIILGVFVAGFLGHRRLRARGAQNLEVIDIALWAVPFGIVGGRIVHVLTHFNDYFGATADPTAAFRIWEGGLAIYGAIGFGAIGAYIGSRLSKVNFLAFADAIAPGLLLAQAIGRLGNYFNQELFGAPTDLPWGLEIDNADAIPLGLPVGTVFQPTFAYEALLSVAGALVLLWLDRKYALRSGRLFAVYLIWYSGCRYIIEGLRIDPSEIFLGLRTFQWFALAGIITGLAILYFQTYVKTGQRTTVYARQAVNEAEFVVDEATETASDAK
ncbi:MAG: prolipoprotein diacylglyceryl transferase [Actinomycetales bacterium]|nr:prolipoprotein diacylglyceryl transferase [Actinomycetales bacterium]